MLLVGTDASGKSVLDRFEQNTSRSRVPLVWPSGYPRKNGRFIQWDPDGDGLTDLLYCSGDDEGWLDFRNLGDGFGGSRPVLPSRGFCDDIQIVATQDGRDFIIGQLSADHFYALGLWSLDSDDVSTVPLPGVQASPTDMQLIAAPDTNGDGLRDLLFLSRDLSEAPQYELWANTGANEVGGGWSFKERGLAMSGFRNGVSIVDYDVDGRSDILFRQDNGGTTEWWIWFGANLGNNRMALVATVAGNHPLPMVLDANGDGRTDYLGGGVLYFGNDPTANLLRTISLPVHATAVPNVIAFTYATGVAPGVYSHGSGAACEGFGYKGTCLKRLTHPVVSQVETRSYTQEIHPGVLQTERLTYHYADARFDVRGRGWVGFGSVTVDQEGIGGVESMRTEEVYDLSPLDEGATGPFYNQDNRLSGQGYHYYYYPYARTPARTTNLWFVPKNDIVRDDVTTGTQTVERIYEVRASDAGLRFVTLKSEDEKTSEGSGLVDHTHADYTYDNYGNFKSSRTRWPLEPGREDVTTLVYAYENDGSRVTKWQVDLVEKSIQSSHASVDGATQTVAREFDYTYKSNGLMDTQTEPLPQEGGGSERLVTSYGYDSRNNVNHVEQKGVSGRKTTMRVWDFEYDPAAGVYVVEAQNPEGHVSRFKTSYGDGLERMVIDANGAITTLKYDGFGQMVEEDRVTAGVVTRVEFAPEKFDGSQILPRYAAYRVRSETRARTGNTSMVAESFYDSVRRIVGSRRDGFGQGAKVYREYVYDSLGRLAKESRLHLDEDESQGIITYGYDSLGRRVSEETADHRVTRWLRASTATSTMAFARPDARWITVVENPKHQRSYQVADARGNVILSVEPVATTEFLYGAADFLLETIDSVGNRTRRVPDGAGRLLGVQDPDNGLMRYDYTPFGEVSAFEQNSQLATFEYDGLGRTVRMDSLDGATTWAWDQVNIGGTVQTRWGELMQAKSPQGHVDTYSYDAGHGMLRRLERRIVTSRGNVDLAATFTYDDLLRPQKITYPGANEFAVEYRYSPSGLLDSVVNANDASETFWKLEEADQGYRAKKIRFGNGTSVTSTFNSTAGWLDALRTDSPADRPLLDYSIGHDANGNTSFVRRHHDAAEATPTYYYYDSADRLETVRKGPAPDAPVIASFSYTSTGNIKTKSGMGTYSYGAEGEGDSGPQTLPHFVRRVSGVGGTHVYAPDAFGRMAPRAGPMVPGARQTFGYNAIGQLARVDTGGTAPNATWQTFEYGADGNRVLKKSSDGSLELRFSTLYEQLLPATGPAQETYRILAGGTTIAEVTRTAEATPEIRYLHRNQLGSVELVTKRDGSVAESRSYGLHGETSDIAPGESVLGYTGHRTEAALGLVDMNARFYDPALGRFISPDPTIPRPGMSQAYNRYSYVYNNPLTLIDPSGYGEADPDDNTSDDGSGINDGGSNKERSSGIPCGLFCMGTAVAVTGGAILAWYGSKNEWGHGKVKDFFKETFPNAVKNFVSDVGSTIKGWFTGNGHSGGGSGGGGSGGAASHGTSGVGNSVAGGQSVGNGTPLMAGGGANARATIGPAPADAQSHSICSYHPDDCRRIATAELREVVFGKYAYTAAEFAASGGILKGVGWGVRAIGASNIGGSLRSLASSYVRGLAESVLTRIGSMSLPYRTSLTVGVRLSRFFVTATRHVSVTSSYVGRLLTRMFPNLQWQQHHVLIQQRWFRAGSSSQLFPWNTLANMGLRRLGNGGWNLLPIPAALNSYLGRSPIATWIFAGVTYGSIPALGYGSYAATTALLGNDDEEEDE